MSKATKFLWRLFFLGLLSFILLIVAINYGLLGEMPPMEELENPASAMSSEVYAADGTLLGNYYIENRSNSEANEISPNVINALIATEDERFYEHSGIDGRAIMRAILLAGKRGGGSTITQQLALNLFAERSPNKWQRILQKLKEWILAVKLETNLTKSEIVTLYLNTVPFGDNVYGIKNASLTFFSKLPIDLTVDEAAVLIGMLKGNTIYNPRKNPDKALNRRNTVIEQMLGASLITPAQAGEYKSKPLGLKYRKADHNDGYAPYFRQVLAEEVKRWCKANKKPNGDNWNIYKDGLQIYTTIDTRMQKFAEEAVAEHMRDLQVQFAAQSKIRNGTAWTTELGKAQLKKAKIQSERYLNMKEAGVSEAEIEKAFNTPVPMTVFSHTSPNNYVDTIMSPLDSIKYMRVFLQAGFMVMDPFNGEIKAWVGGINHRYFQLDHVYNTERQVGSTIKPLLYCFAVDHGFSPCQTISTAPQMFKGQKKAYNAGGSAGGAMEMSRALALSINNASLYLLNQVGIESFIDFAKEKCGITGKMDPVPSVALGVSDISLFQMIGAYTMFPNRGIRTEPLFISKIEDKNGNVIYNATVKQSEIISESTAHKMVTMMQGATQFGTAARLRYRYGFTGEMAGKTGTTNNQADAWYIGYTPQLLAGSWVGCEDRFLTFSSTAQGQGAAAALPIWGLFFKKLYSDATSGYTDKEKFVVPPNFNRCGGGFYGGAADRDSDDTLHSGQPGDPGNGNAPQSESHQKPRSEPQEVIVPIDDWQ